MEKIWLKNYQKGVPNEIVLNKYSSITELFLRTCKRYGNDIAYVNFGTKITFNTLEKQTRKFASFLQNTLALKKGSRIALMLPNVLQYPVALFGALRAGLVVVNVNPLYTPRELIHQLNDSGTRTIIVLENFAQTVEIAKAMCSLDNIIITKIGDLHPFPKNVIMNLVNKYVKKNVKPYKIPEVIEFNNALKLGSKDKFSVVEMTGDDIAFLQYTGGTTGIAKGAILTNYNILSNVEQATSWIIPQLEYGTETVITALPLYHIFSLTANCFTFLAIGARNVLITNPRDIDGFIKELKSIKFTCFTGVNTLFNAMLNNKKFKDLDFSLLKLTLGGGMSVQESVATRWQEITGCPLLEAYGLTETSPAVSINPINSKGYNGSVGLPISSTEVTIRDINGKELQIGDKGELWVKGPQVMYGYWQNEEESKNAFTDGWFRTGDIATIDSDGYLYIVDRLKDMILVSGFNVYPNEVEDIIASHPDVLEVGVVGDEVETGNEVVVAFVVGKNESLTEDKLKHFCRDKLTRYKVPKIIHFVKELPKSNIGKILRKDLHSTINA